MGRSLFFSIVFLECKSMKCLGITAVNGGAGKTIVSIGLTAWFRNNGFKVTAFKKGPDYIDAGWLALASGKPCYNLDLFLMNPEDVVGTFYGRSRESDVAIIEGNRGLFDGVDSDGTCSTAELFKLLDVPAILIIDVTKMTRTAAAVVLGFQKMDPQLHIAGVILNKVGGSRHERVARESIEKICNLPVVGAIPRKKDNFFPERHLGLLPVVEHGLAEDAVCKAMDMVSSYVDVEGLLKILKRSDNYRDYFSFSEKPVSVTEKIHCKIGVIRDGAFQFYYPENLEALTESGAELSFFSSDSSSLPQDIDGLYIGGGFPETHLERLANNRSLRTQVLEAIEKGMPVYAECGGLMFLGRSITYNERTYPMVGALPVDLVMCRKPQGHGYTVGKVVGENPYYVPGEWIKGHEFHYSKVASSYGTLNFAVKLKKGHGIIEQFDGMVYKNCVAFYSHIHAVSCRKWGERFVSAAMQYRNGMKSGKIFERIPPVMFKGYNRREKFEGRR